MMCHLRLFITITSGKCAAEALDIASEMFKDDLLPILLPLLQTVLATQEWQLLESGVLALGAIAQGQLQQEDEEI